MTKYGEWKEAPPLNFPSMTPEVLQKLKDGFMRGYTNGQAAFFAGIGLSTLQAYIKNTEGYSEQVALYKGNMNILAKNNVWCALKEEGSSNIKDAITLLDRVENKNYNTKSQVDTQPLDEDGKPTNTIKVEFVGKK